MERVGVLDQYSRIPQRAKFKNDPVEIQGRVISREATPKHNSTVDFVLCLVLPALAEATKRMYPLQVPLTRVRDDR